MLGVAAGGLEERHLRQRSLVDRLQHFFFVFQVLRAVCGARREARVVVERLVVRLEDRARVRARVDHRALRLRILPPVGKRRVPAAGIPGPGNAFRRERVANRAVREWRRRKPGRIREIEAAAGRGRGAARLVGRLRRVDEVAVR